MKLSIDKYAFIPSTNPFAFDTINRLPIDDIAADISKLIDSNFQGSQIIIRGIQSGKHSEKFNRDDLTEFIQQHGSDNYENIDGDDIIFAAKYNGIESIQEILSGFHVYKPKCNEIPQYPVDIWMIFDLNAFENISYIHPRHNVVKSSLVNALVGFERVVANPTPGTTRDAVDTIFTCNKKRYCLIDTAGIRRKGKTSQKLEKYSVVDSLRSIDRADVVLIVLNAEEGITEQDKHIAGYVFEAGRSCLFVVNKWDTLTKDNKTLGDFVERIQYEFKFLAFAPIVFVSAKSGQRIHKVMETVAEVYQDYSKRVTTAELNRVFKEAVEAHHAPLHQGRRVKFYFATQVGVKPPTFAIFTNQPDGIQTPYERYLGNRFRAAFGFKGTPFRLLFRGRDSKAANRRPPA
jgi:small GTP-binding protein